MTRSLSGDDILDAALRRASQCHWEQLRLVDIADELGVPLARIHECLADKESLVDALWDRADRALLQRAGDAALKSLDVPQRIETLVLAWLAPLSPHRRCVREMLLVRLEPGHLHIQLPTLVRISRTVQWIREAANLRATFAWRAMEESALSALFIATVTTWLQDDGEQRARRRLARGLRIAERVRGHIGPRNDDNDQ